MDARNADGAVTTAATGTFAADGLDANGTNDATDTVPGGVGGVDKSLQTTVLLQ